MSTQHRGDAGTLGEPSSSTKGGEGELEAQPPELEENVLSWESRCRVERESHALWCGHCPRGVVTSPVSRFSVAWRVRCRGHQVAGKLMRRRKRGNIGAIP